MQASFIFFCIFTSLACYSLKKNCIVKLYDKCLDDKGIRYNRSYISDWPFGTDRADLPRTIALLDPVKPLRNHTDLPSMPPEVKPI